MRLTLSVIKNSLKKTESNFLQNSLSYLKDSFPIIKWLPRYNKTWLVSDIIAGVTVGIIVIPQSLVYAKLAGLPLQFGLYTSFIGVVIYPFFATSKDVTIGPTAVISQLSGQLLSTYNVGPNSIDPVLFSVAAAFFAGALQLAIGLLRLGVVVDLIPTPVIAGFTSGAGVTIIIAQIAGALGIPGINTNDAAYRILINTIQSLGLAKLDAAFGIGSLLLLVLFRVFTAFYVKRGYTWFKWVRQSSNFVTIILTTLISFLINRGLPTPLFRIVGNVPQGLNYIQLPEFEAFNKVLPATLALTLVCILEHVAVTKSFGRLNGYRPVADQEIIAIGATNLLGSFFGGFPATGSFSRSSINSNSGVRTPLAGFFTAGVVFLAIYVITPAVYYIPNAALSALIINAITDLISRPAIVKELWDIEFFDFLAFLIAFILTIFFSIETSIYASVIFSLLVLLYRVARPRVHFLQRDESGGWINYKEASASKPMPIGIAVFRIEEALTYPNASYLTNTLKDWVLANTKYNGVKGPKAEKLWCDDTKSFTDLPPSTTLPITNKDIDKPVLRAVVIDCSAINSIDATGLQTLIDIRNDMEVHSGGSVLFYFAHVRPQFRHILEHFQTLVKRNHDITPVIANTSNYPCQLPQGLCPCRCDLPVVAARAIEELRKTGVGSREYLDRFFAKSIDGAVEAAVEYIGLLDVVAGRSCDSTARSDSSGSVRLEFNAAVSLSSGPSSSSVSNSK